MPRKSKDSSGVYCFRGEIKISMQNIKTKCHIFSEKGLRFMSFDINFYTKTIRYFKMAYRKWEVKRPRYSELSGEHVPDVPRDH